MGSCVAHSQKQGHVNRSTNTFEVSRERSSSINAMNSSEIHLLRLMFEDLAARSETQKVSCDDFDVFFHLNGLWRQQVFRYFDSNQHNQLTFEDFKIGMAKLVKGPLKERVEALFSFYDTNRTSSICYSDIVTMMYSYQKDQLKKITDENKFISTLTSKQKQDLFGKCCFNEEKEVVEEYETQHCSQGQVEQEVKSKLSTKKSIRSIKSVQIALIRPSLQHMSSGSISYFDAHSKRNVKIASNVSVMVRKYVDFLFNQLGLKKETDAMSLDQFTYLISRHQQIFDSYYEGFHTYIWQTNEEGFPINKQIPMWISSNCILTNSDSQNSKKIFMKYIKSTLFIYKQEKDNLPIEIINLEGLQLEQIEKNGKYGFLLKHSSGNYPEKYYLFSDKLLLQEWMKHLGHLKSVSFHQKYKLMQKIGNGNFSTVYKGIQRQSNTQVAVKVIVKEKLSAIQKYIIRHQCEVLELCHHPCVVKFIEKIESKTHIYLVTQLLGDGDLYDYICEKKCLSEQEASFIMKELLQTIRYLHTVGLIHRDIKPENIILRKQGGQVERVKLIDFGFAVFKNSLDSLKQCQKFAGTPGYSAPEIYKLQSYDSSVDNFSLGVLLHFMLSGSLPFDSQCNDDIKRLTLKGVVGMKGSRWAKVSEEAKDLIRGLLKSTEQRISIEDALIHPWIQKEELRVNEVSRSEYTI